MFVISRYIVFRIVQRPKQPAGKPSGFLFQFEPKDQPRRGNEIQTRVLRLRFRTEAGCGATSLPAHPHKYARACESYVRVNNMKYSTKARLDYLEQLVQTLEDAPVKREIISLIESLKADIDVNYAEISKPDRA